MMEVKESDELKVSESPNAAEGSDGDATLNKLLPRLGNKTSETGVTSSGNFGIDEVYSGPAETNDVELTPGQNHSPNNGKSGETATLDGVKGPADADKAHKPIEYRESAGDEAPQEERDRRPSMLGIAKDPLARNSKLKSSLAFDGDESALWECAVTLEPVELVAAIMAKSGADEGAPVRKGRHCFQAEVNGRDDVKRLISWFEEATDENSLARLHFDPKLSRTQRASVHECVQEIKKDLVSWSQAPPAPASQQDRQLIVARRESPLTPGEMRGPSLDIGDLPDNEINQRAIIIGMNVRKLGMIDEVQNSFMAEINVHMW